MKKLLFLIAVAGLVVGFLMASILLMPPEPVPASPAAAHTLTSSPAATASTAVKEMLQATVIFEVYKIPSDYYNQSCQKPAHLTFYDWMAELEMPPYEKEAFDCSQMAVYIEWLSENCNHRATIAGASFEGYGHAWVMIDLGDIPFAYEPGRWVPREGEGSTHYHYDPDTEWENIYDAPWAHDRFKEEYAWWESYPELWEGTK